MSTDLELVSTDDLVAELNKRFDSCLFLGSQEMENSKRYIARHWRSANMYEMLGLVEEFRHLALLRLTRPEHPDNENPAPSSGDL